MKRCKSVERNDPEVYKQIEIKSYKKKRNIAENKTRICSLRSIRIHLGGEVEFLSTRVGRIRFQLNETPCMIE